MDEQEHLVSIAKLAGNTFTVSDYQRGYKWGKQEVLDLLEDINAFDKARESFYCLQPIVLKGGHKNYELIDGQQRLTTSFMILKALGEKVYTLRYLTREETSAAFLNDIEDLPFLNSSDENKVIKGWEEYIAEHSSKDCIDNYHFFCAYQYILHFLSNTDTDLFRNKFLDHTRVIWYEIKSHETPENVFIKFNKGKIHLEQAELIKALFVLSLKKETNAGLRAHKISQFAEDWNRIENQLQDDKFWFFVSNDSTDKRKSNRIDLLFDIKWPRKSKDDKPLYSYFKYLEKFKDNSDYLPESDWQAIVGLFNMMFDWFHDRSLYHLLGMTIYLGIVNLSSLVTFYEDDEVCSKEDFATKIKGKLRTTLLSEKYKLSNLTYQEPLEVKHILLLFNIATYQTSDFNYRFPFNKLKTQRWSLEHIHAQNAELFTTIQEIKEWIADIKLLLNDDAFSGGKEDILIIISELESMLITANDGALSSNIKQKVKQLHSRAKELFNSDRITNLCLLDGATNSSIGNSIFVEKRKRILQIDMAGEAETEDGFEQVFIPICTKNVFMKYYNSNPHDIQFTYWGNSDRKDYETNIESTIKKYLS